MLLNDTEVARCHQDVTCKDRRRIGRGSVISMLFEANQRHHVWNQDCHEDGGQYLTSSTQTLHKETEGDARNSLGIGLPSLKTVAIHILLS